MSTTRNTNYLESRVLTASQPQLHLMLIEGAIRFGQQAQQMWGDASTRSQADLLFTRMLDLVEELVHSTTKGKGDVSKQLEEQYAFLYRELAACLLSRDQEQLAACLKLLEYQRQTWKMACEWIGSQPAAPATPAGAIVPHLPVTNVGGFSVEA